MTAKISLRKSYPSGSLAFSSPPDTPGGQHLLSDITPLGFHLGGAGIETSVFLHLSRCAEMESGTVDSRGCSASHLSACSPVLLSVEM